MPLWGPHIYHSFLFLSSSIAPSLLPPLPEAVHSHEAASAMLASPHPTLFPHGLTPHRRPGRGSSPSRLSSRGIVPEEIAARQDTTNHQQFNEPVKQTVLLYPTLMATRRVCWLGASVRQEVEVRATPATERRVATRVAGPGRRGGGDGQGRRQWPLRAARGSGSI